MSGSLCTAGDFIEGFNRFLASRAGESGFPAGSPGLKRYQVYVACELVRAVDEGERFVIVSMPTGSGKTFLEMFAAFYADKKGFRRVLVLEPTRFLCDQMFKKLWSKVFGSSVGREYEGECRDFLDPAKTIVISTPITAWKCVRGLGEDRVFDFVVVDEVHHLFGNRFYIELLSYLKPRVSVGFTALLPSEKLFSAHELEGVFGRPKLLHYDFRKLAEVDQDFKPPLAIADLFEAELSESELKVYDKLLSGGLAGDPREDIFLERALVSHGKRAFCESYRRFLDSGEITRNDVADSLCSEPGYSHKARAVLEVADSYSVNQWQGKLMLVYTRRVVTAQEIGEALRGRLQGHAVELLTGHASRDEKLELLRKLREDSVLALVSTRVGEEGIDIPEAKLLVMADITRSPLSFYQRIGRLIRMGSPEKLKHLAIVLTPETFEYDNLEEVLWRLYEEGVDVSYIVTNIDITGKTSVDHVVSVVSRVEGSASLPPSVPFLIYGREATDKRITDMISYFVESRDSDPEVREILEELTSYRGLRPESAETLKELVFITLVINLGSRDLKKKILRKLKISEVARNRMYELLNKAIRMGKLLYIYDTDTLADIIAYEIARLYLNCARGYCENLCFRLDKKEMLRSFTRVFTFSKLDEVLENLRKSVEKYKGEVKSLRNGLNVNSWVYTPIWNERQKALIFQGYALVSTQERTVRLLAQVNYYDVHHDLLKEGKKIKELLELNLEASLWEALLKFLESQATQEA
jgi:superfamily II DNA or RNA helicase